VPVLVFLAAISTVLGSTPDRTARIDGILAPWSGVVPGVVVVVIQNGRVVFAKGYGLADVATHTPMTPMSRVGVGSLTKQFTAAAIVLLERNGMLRFEDPITKFVPEISVKGVTLRMLLQHRSGLPDVTRDREGMTTQEMIAAFEKADLSHIQPGMAYAYNNAGFGLLALVIERISHQSYPTFVQHNLLDAAGMHDSTIATLQSPARGVIHTYRNEEIYEAPVEAMMPGPAGLVTNGNDFSKWYVALDRSGLLRDYERDITAAAPSRHGGELAYNDGWVIGHSNGVLRLSHGGSWRGEKNYVLRYPEKKLTVVLFANSFEFAPHRHEVAYSIAKLFLPHLDVRGRDIETITDDCVSYRVKEAAAGAFVLGGAEDIHLRRSGTVWIRDPWPYGSDLAPASLTPCPSRTAAAQQAGGQAASRAVR